MVHGLSCSAARGMFPDQGSNPCPLHWQADSILFYSILLYSIYLWLRCAFIAVHGFLIVVASLVAEHGL